MYQEEYKGHWINVDVLSRGKAWSWTYQIDSGPIRSSEDRPLRSEALMQQEALSQARREIDRMR